MEGPIRAHLAGLAKSFKTGDFSDFTIFCGTKTYKVHKNIICAQSEYFRAACESGRFTESSTNIITLKAISAEDADDTCDEPGVISLMVYYFYHLDYTATRTAKGSLTPASDAATILTTPPCHLVPTTPSSTKKRNHTITSTTSSPASATTQGATDNDMIMHAKVFAAATKYHIHALKDLAAVKFRTIMEQDWDHDTFPEAVSVAFTTTADGERALRNAVVDTIHRKRSLLDKPAVEAVVSEIGGLALEMLKRTRVPAMEPPSTPAVKPLLVPRDLRCLNCRHLSRSPWTGQYKRCANCGSQRIVPEGAHGRATISDGRQDHHEASKRPL